MWYADDRGIYHSSNENQVMQWIYVSFVVAGHERLDPELRKIITVAGDVSGDWITFDALEDEDGFEQLVNNLADYLPGLDKDWFAKAIAKSGVGENRTVYESDEYRALSGRDKGADLAQGDDDISREETELYEWLDETYAKLEDDWFDAVSKLKDYEKSLCRLFWLHAEVGNGGLQQYFYNSASDDAEAAVSDLRRIGRDDVAELLEKANRLIGSPVPGDVDERRLLLENLSEDESEELAVKLDVMDCAVSQGWLGDLRNWFDAESKSAPIQ